MAKGAVVCEICRSLVDPRREICPYCEAPITAGWGPKHAWEIAGALLGGIVCFLIALRVVVDAVYVVRPLRWIHSGFWAGCILVSVTALGALVGWLGGRARRYWWEDMGSGNW